MSQHTMFIAVDPDAVFRDVVELATTRGILPSGIDLEEMTDAENENNSTRTILAQKHFYSGVVALHAYRALAGFRWDDIEEVVVEGQVGANVTFPSRNAAMLWKLSQP